MIENTQLIKKNLKCTNCAISAFLGKWVLCFFYLFSFQFTFAQLYQSGGVAIVGISEITIVPSKDQIGNVYVSKGASIYNAENISSTKIIVLKNPQKKAIFKEELATTNKTHKSKYSKEITALEKKSNFNFIGGKSDEAFKITFEKKYIALSNTNNQSKISSTPSTQISADNINKANIIKSPMVGTAYLAPEPGAKPFISVGANIKKGQTIIIIEAMKTMNHVLVIYMLLLKWKV